MIVTELLQKISQPRGKLGRGDYDAMVPIFEKSKSVPKNLFQICLRDDGMNADELMESFPFEMKKAISKIRETNTDWNYKLLSAEDAEQFILEKYGKEVYSYYERINPRYGAARADFLRYLLLYRYGGVYIDIKCGLSRGLNESILSGKFPVFFWDNMPGGNHHPAIPENIKEGEILQGFIVSSAGHPFLRAVILEVMRRIDNYNPYIDGVGYGGTMKITGPGLYSETIYSCMLNRKEECYIAKPFADFGFILNNVGTLWTTQENYQRKVKMTDYRKRTEPLVSSGCKVIDVVNSIYMSFCVWYRNVKELLLTEGGAKKKLNKK